MNLCWKNEDKRMKDEREIGNMRWNWLFPNSISFYQLIQFIEIWFILLIE